MDQIDEVQPTITPNQQLEQQPAQAPPQSAQASQPTTTKPRQFPLKILIGILSVLLIGTLVGLSIAVVRLNQRQLAAPAPTPTPPPPTPTPVRILSKFATESAFLNFETTVSSLSAVISGYPIFDASLTPPKLDLPLGFGN